MANLLAQQVTLNALNQQAIVGFESEKQLQQGDQRGEKRPDVVWHLASGARMAVEIELSAKWQVRLDQFIDHIISGLDPALHDGQPPYARFAVVSDSQVLLDRYRAAIQPGQMTARCARDSAGRLVRAECYPVPEWAHRKISFLLLD